MKIEDFDKAKIILYKIKEKKEFLEYFDCGYSNSINSYKQNTGCFFNASRSIRLSSEPELAKIIRSYIENQIKELEKQLEKL